MGSEIDLSKMSRAQKQAMLKELMDRKKQRDSYYPLSSGQKGLWFLQGMTPDSYAYNLPCAFKIQEAVDIQALERALTCLLDRRPILGTRFKTGGDGQPLQSEASQSPVFFKTQPIEEMTDLELEQFLRAIAHEPFDLETGPLFRTYLFSYSPEQHILLVNFHHIIFDGSSFPLFIEELVSLYQGELTGKKATLPEIGSCFCEYVKWQDKMIAGPEGKAHKDYWLETLGPDLPVLNLFADICPDPQNESSRCETFRVKISSDLSSGLRQVAARNRVYLFSVLLSAFKVLLKRHTGQDDIITGIPMAGRTRTEFEDLIGYFINMIPLRADLSGDIRFSDLMQQVHAASMGAMAHQDYPYPEIVKALRQQGHSGDSPLFETSFVLQNWAKGAKNRFDGQEGLKLIPMLNIQQEEDVNLALEVLDFEQIEFFFKYDASRYSQESISRMAAHFKSLLGGILENPDQKITRLPLLTALEREKILVQWNDTKSDFPHDRCLHELIQDQAQKKPDAIALVLGKTQLTYGQLNKQANQVGRYLRELGIGPGTRVAVCMDRSLDMMIGLLGILKAGGTYVPMDPEYPKDRILYMLEDASPPVILTQTNRTGALPAHHARVVCLDELGPEINGLDDSNLFCEVTGEDLAYIIYTSGSTGQPKGVMIRHRGVPNLAQAQIRLFGITQEARVLQFASMSFDASISEIAMTFCAGACLVLAPKSELLPGQELSATLTGQAITHVTLPPSALAVMDPGRLTGLSTLVVAGEACPPELAALWSENRTFINAYGPTESTVCASAMVYDGRKGPLPIGRPIDNIQLFILDPNLEPVPAGVAGELHIAGVGLALGYLNRPEQTQEKFIDNPFDREAGGRLYKTGDLCRFLHDGNIEFLGRMDHQVKIRGFRIEPGEIETVIRSHGGIKDAVVIPKQGQLVAYVTPENGAPAPGQNELRLFLKSMLPEFMIPAPFVSLPEMPLTPNGKIDRKALPKADLNGMREQDFVAPQTRVQQELADIWKAVLDIDAVSIHDDFFMMGGHSLLATIVISRVQKAFNLRVPIARMFDFPTIGGFGDYLEGLVETESYSQIQPLDRDQPLELSFAQQRLWFLDKFEGGNFVSYNVPMAFRVSGPVDIPAFDRAINEIIRRHEVLRTVFQEPLDGHRDTQGRDKDLEPFALQVILPELKSNLTLKDVSTLEGKDREAAAGQILADACLAPFDLSSGPLIRTLLVRMDAREHLALICLHHIVFDGWSVGVFIDEFRQLYEAYAQDLPSPLPEFDIQYADFAHWQRKTLTGDTLAGHLDYWKKQLADTPLSTELPMDRPRPPVQTFNGDFVPFELDPGMAEQLNRLSQSCGATLFMTLYAAFAVLLSRYSAKEDIVIGTPVANRNHVQTEHLIGFFVNTLALRADLSGDPEFSKLLMRVKKCTLEAYDHQDLPFERLLVTDELNIERSMSHSPLFQVMFDLNTDADKLKFETGGLDFSYFDMEYTVAKFDLSLSMASGEQGIVGRFQYNTDLFDRTTIERAVGHLKILLADIVAHPEKRISKLCLLTPAETDQLIHGFNQTQRPFPQDRCVHQIFEQMAKDFPDSPAVIFEDEILTYKGLDARSNQVARYLQKQGVGPDIMVGLHLERSFELIVGMMGILKAGGAYVPMDPGYPKERIAYMVKDSNAPVVLTQAKLTENFAQSNAAIVCLDTHWDKIALEGTQPLACQVTPDNLIYVIYTSGTTGNPKGVMIEHRSVCAREAYAKELYGLTQRDVAIHYRPYSFDGSIEEYLLPLLLGAHYIMAPPDITVTDNIATYLIQAVEKYKITKLNLPPVLLDVFLAELERLGVHRADTVRTIISGGDRLSRDIVHKLAALFGDSKAFYNGYGPTENTNDSLIWRCNMAEGQGRVLIGKAIANSQAYILDRHRQLLPIGAAGELYVSGVGLARGYLNRSDLTQKAFLPNPFDPETSPRIYRTGDLCRYLPDGNVEFLGRVDHQVKIRGFRIELGEIESVLVRHERVLEAIVIAREDQPGNKQLAGYVTPVQGETPPTSEDLREYLKQILPDYMVPPFIIVMDALPVTSNGKFDRKALPAPDMTGLVEDYKPPKSPKEKILAKIWSQILGAGRVGLNDNFFSLGGDSILSIRVVSKAGDKGLFLTVKHIFEHQTLVELAKAAAFQKQVHADQGMVTGPLPFTPIMEAFFKLPCINPHHFNQYVAFRASSTWDARIIGKALWELVAHHDALRLCFSQASGQWTALGADMSCVSEKALLDVVDLSLTPRDERSRVVDDHMEKCQKQFDLVSGPLIKAVLFQTGETENALWIIIHHLVVDGVSWRIFMEDFQRLCTLAADGEKMVLPLKSTSFRDWAHRLQTYAGSDEVIGEKEFWLGQDHDPDLPVDHDFGPLDNTLEASRILTLTLSKNHTHALLYKAPEVFGARINILLLSAVLMALGRWTGRSKIMIGCEGHGRESLFEDVDTSRTMGWFASLYPVILGVGNGLEKTVTLVKEALSAIPNNGIGYGVLRHMCPDKTIRDTFDALPDPKIVFNYFGQIDESFASSDLTFDRFGFSESAGRTRKPLIDIGGGVMDGALEIAFSYCSKIHDAATIQQVVDTVADNLDTMIEGCTAIGQRPMFVHRAFPQFPELIYLNNGTKGTPVFWIHGGLGGVGAYVNLAKHIQRPFYGIQARGYMSDRTPLTGVREKASYYLRVIRAAQPQGPYHLGGYSYGGTLAYEITCQLQALGESVESIVMLDSTPGSRDEDQTAPYFDGKQAMLQAVNIALFESEVLNTNGMTKRLIHRSELDAGVDDDLFLSRLIENPKAKRLFKTKEKAEAQVRSVLKTIEKSHAEKYWPTPLAAPDSVTCHYFRNKGGELLGDLEPYFTFENEAVKEQPGYWEAWEKYIPDFHLIDVDSPNHMTMLTDPKSLEKIAQVCQALYG